MWVLRLALDSVVVPIEVCDCNLSRDSFWNNFYPAAHKSAPGQHIRRHDRSSRAVKVMCCAVNTLGTLLSRPVVVQQLVEQTPRP